MSRVEYFFPEQSVSEVIEKLIQYRISGAPVVDHEHRLIGVISEGLFKQVSDSRYYNMPVGQSNVEIIWLKMLKLLMVI